MAAYNQRCYSFAGLMAEHLPSVMRSDSFADVAATCSPQQKDRRMWQPVLPLSLRSPASAVGDENVKVVVPDAKAIAELFPKLWGSPFLKIVNDRNAQEWGKRSPLRIGVVLSGGQAAGGHNVIAGLYDFVKQCNPQSQLIGFLNGPHGIFTHNYREITEEYMNLFRNMGGFDMICSGRHKIETEEQKRSSMEICQKLELHGLCIIGGDDSNTNQLVLAEYFKQNGCKTNLVGCPKTIDGDLKNEYIEISFGFDTAIKTYSELIGNLCVDAATSQDRYHFVRLMGRSASNIALECALQTRANLTVIGEEIQADNRSLKSIADEIADMVIKRAALGKEYGVILLPEGLLEFVPEVGVLISEINDLLHDGPSNFSVEKLSADSRKVFEFLPESIRGELLLERDSHGNVQVAKIATERLLIMMTRDELARRQFTGTFIPTDHYFGYEGRCAMPSNFDANYCYALGHTAGCLIDNNVSGYMAVVRNLRNPVEHWVPAGCPVAVMMNIERRKGKDVPVIKKYLVELDKPMFLNFKKVRDEWKYKDLFRNPGPIQFEGACADLANCMIHHPDAEYLLPEVPTESKCLIPKSIGVMSELQVERLHYRPAISPILQNPKSAAIPAKKCDFQDQQAERFVRRSFPLQCDRHSMRAYAIEPCESSNATLNTLRIGVVLGGQPVPGAMNVVQGLFDRLALIGGKLIGFKGITGLLENKHLMIEKEDLSLYVNQGGFEMLGRTPQTKSQIRTDEGIAKVEKTCADLDLDGLVIIGGQTSLTDAAVLTEHFLACNLRTKVVGVPANQENNIQHTLMETPIGFDSTSKSYASLIGNLLTDAASATKYWYFVRLMGFGPSHIVLEAGLQTHPNFTVISERYVDENMNLTDVVRDIADVVEHRAAAGKNFGTVLIPEGLVSSLPQMKTLISEIDKLLSKHRNNNEMLQQIREDVSSANKDSEAFRCMTPWSAALLATLPDFFRAQLVRQTPTGHIELSEIAAEQLISLWVEKELAERKKLGTYTATFAPVCHYFGFQGRSSLPSNFDCALAVAHGYLASILIESNLTGMMTSVRGLCGKPKDWRFTAVPISVLLRIMPEIETNQYGRKVPIIPCNDVNLKGTTYNTFIQGAETWEMADNYCNPGPIQFSGISSTYFNRTLYEEQYDYISMLGQLDTLVGTISGVCSFGVNKSTLRTAVTSLKALATIISDKSS